MKKVILMAAVLGIAACGNLPDVTGEGRVNGSDIIGDGAPVAGLIAAGALVGI